MLLLIDAYNLMHHSDVLQRGRGPRWLEQARRRLIRRLADHLDATLAAETCLVFDAHAAPGDLPDRYRLEAMQLLFAVEYPEADDLIEELIARHPAPRRLTVVSSDHRIQRAAARRGAAFFDADVWYDALVESGPRLGIRWPPAPTEELNSAPEKPPEPTTAAEMMAWYEHFSLEVPRRHGPQHPRPAAGPPPPPGGPTPSSQPAPQPPADVPSPPPAPAPEKSREKPKEKPKERSPRRSSHPVPQPPASQRRPRRQPRTPPHDPHRPLDPRQDNPFPDGYAEDEAEGLK